MTDLEFYEVRYSGRAARAVRGFRAVYLGLFFNCMIMATVNLAACKIAGVLFGLERWQTLVGVGLLNVVFAAHSGLWGVLVIDMIQFFIKMSAVIAAAYFAVNAPEVGGLDALITRPSSSRSRRHQLPQRPAGFLEQLGRGRRGVHHARGRAVVGGVVSRGRAGRRQLRRAADAGVEIRARLARRGAVLQRRPLRAPALAVDPGGAGLDHRLSGVVGPAAGAASRRPVADRHDIAYPAMLKSCRPDSSA